jgi:hypothetical protein
VVDKKLGTEQLEEALEEISNVIILSMKILEDGLDWKDFVKGMSLLANVGGLVAGLKDYAAEFDDLDKEECGRLGEKLFAQVKRVHAAKQE